MSLHWGWLGYTVGLNQTFQHHAGVWGWALKGLSLPPNPSNSSRLRALPRGAAVANREESDLGLQRKSLATVLPEFKKWVPLSLWPTTFPQERQSPGLAIYLFPLPLPLSKHTLTHRGYESAMLSHNCWCSSPVTQHNTAEPCIQQHTLIYVLVASQSHPTVMPSLLCSVPHL